MKQSQNTRLLAYLKQYGSITQREAIKHLNIYRLSARIYDLKRRGEPITPVEISVNNTGCPVGNYTRYYLENK